MGWIEINSEKSTTSNAMKWISIAYDYALSLSK